MLEGCLKIWNKIAILGSKTTDFRETILVIIKIRQLKPVLQRIQLIKGIKNKKSIKIRANKI